jgi:hypothetical protein
VDSRIAFRETHYSKPRVASIASVEQMCGSVSGSTRRNQILKSEKTPAASVEWQHPWKSDSENCKNSSTRINQILKTAKTPAG